MEMLLNFKTDSRNTIKFQLCVCEREKERVLACSLAISRDKNDFIKIQQVDRKFLQRGRVGGITLNVV